MQLIIDKYIKENIVFFNEKNERSNFKDSTYASIESYIIKPMMTKLELLNISRKLNIPITNDYVVGVEHEINFFDHLMTISYPDDVYEFNYDLIDNMILAIELNNAFSTALESIETAKTDNCNDKNMNELRHMPKDIDLLISTAKSLVEKHKSGGDIETRMALLERLTDSVQVDYLNLLKCEIKDK